MSKFNPATATKSELETRIVAYRNKAAAMVEQDSDSPAERKQIENLRLCATDLAAVIARRFPA